MSITKLQGAHTVTSNSFNVVASWVNGLHESEDICDVLAKIANLFGCEAAIISRYSSWDKKVKTIVCSVLNDQITFPPRNPRPLCHDMLGDTLLTAKPGAIWTYTNADDQQIWENSEHLQTSMSRQSLRDAVIMYLDARMDENYCLELHFSSQISESDSELISQMAEALSKSWQGRRAGFVRKLLANSRLTQVSSRADRIQQAILGTENPAGLSRSEYRICSLVQEGMAAKKIAIELSILETTVRSHLHSIYGKTDTSGQLELLHKLTTIPPKDAGIAVGKL